MSSPTQDTECQLSDCRKAKRNVAAYKKLVADNKDKHDAEIKKLEEEKALAARITARRLGDTHFEGRGELQKQLTAAQNIASACQRDHANFNPEVAEELAEANVKLGEQAAEIEKLKQERVEKVRKLNEANGDLIKVQRALVDKEKQEALNNGDAHWRAAMEELKKSREQVDLANQLFENYKGEIARVQGQLDEEKRLREQDVKREKQARENEVATAKEQLEDAHRREVADLRSRIQNLRENATETLKIEKDAWQKEVVELEAQLEVAHKEEVTALQSELQDARNNEVATVKSEKDAHEKEILRVKVELEDAYKREGAEIKADLEKLQIELDASKKSERNSFKELEDVSKAAAAAKLSPPTIATNTKAEPIIPITPILIQSKTATVPTIVITSSTGEDTQVPVESTAQDHKSLQDKVNSLEGKVTTLSGTVKYYQKESRIRWGKQKAYIHAIYTSQTNQPLVYSKGEWDGSSLNRVGKMEYLRMQVLGVTSQKVKGMIDASLPKPPTGIRKRGGNRNKEREVVEIEMSDDEDNASAPFEFFQHRRNMREKHEGSNREAIDKALMETCQFDMKRWDQEMMRSFSISGSIFPQQSGINTTQSTAHPNTSSTIPIIPVPATATSIQATILATTITPPTLPSPDFWSLVSLLSWMASYWL
ncbi:hypothetical protein IFR05_002704 [Cadophora sp. M221]|nr:hypothetical protein IFR05_002704 [Cadophora sp. M221]